MIISIDGGTTNTRLVLVDGGAVLSERREPFGAGTVVAGEHFSYSAALSSALSDFLKENRRTEADIDAIITSGMICSEYGLAEVPHLEAPVSTESLGEKAVRRSFPEMTPIPFWMIPGVRMFSVAGTLSGMDMMRGEETELFGILSRMGRGECTVVLPGTHCKVIRTDAEGRLCRFYTLLNGETIRALAEHTILRDGIRGAYPKKTDHEMLLSGYDYAIAHSFNEALFKVRVLQKYRRSAPEELYSFLCGAVLSGDISGIVSYAGNGKILVGGSDPLRDAYVTLLRERSACDAVFVPEEVARYATAYGAWEIYRAAGREALRENINNRKEESEK